MSTKREIKDFILAFCMTHVGSSGSMGYLNIKDLLSMRQQHSIQQGDLQASFVSAFSNAHKCLWPAGSLVSSKLCKAV